MQELTTISEAVQYIVIEIGNEKFGIDIRYVDNIVRMQRMTRVPKVAPYLKGVINLRGEVVPVMSLRIKMGLEEVENTKATRIIILKFEQGCIGVIVDEVREVVTLDEEHIEKMSYEGREDAFVTSIGKDTTGGLISLLDLNALILDMN